MKRTQMGSPSNTLHRRSRSLSRRSGRFVNTERGSGILEISLDDLVPNDDYEKESLRRGRSVSRRGPGKGNLDNNSGGKGISDSNSRTRPSVSVARYQATHSETMATRILNRFSGRFHPSDPDDEHQHRSRRFVNTERGSGFPETSLDDLGSEFFLANEDDGRQSTKGRLGCRLSAASPSTLGTVVDESLRKGLLVSRNHGKSKFDNNSGGKDASDCNSRRRRSVSVSGDKDASDCNSRRRHSVSVARYQCSDSESDTKHSPNSISHTKTKSFSNGNFQRPSLHKPNTPYHQHVLKRSLSLKDLLQSHDGYSDACGQKNGIEKTICAVYAQKKSEHPIGDGVDRGLYEAMRLEVRHAVEQIRTELEQRSNERGRVSRRLTEEAEKYSEDFISNVKDTDLSSFDGERSDASSTMGRSRKLTEYTKSEIGGNPTRADSLTVEMDGIVLPWLQWETNNESSPLSFKTKMELAVASGNNVLSTAQEASGVKSSDGSWSPDYRDRWCAVSREECGSSRFVMMELGKSSSEYGVSMHGVCSFDMDKYLNHGGGGGGAQEILFDKFRYCNRIQSGGLILCDPTFL
ncbi:uncharacterized protein LOC143855661 isoform X2 [Tasmannia lanceolata]|uniref:uncharacterized protein LOC143855661 isoform X2 n=1 Tax=Tasmannia lanceolata TaxID=3420 RepID=UPI0040631813